MRFLLLRHPIQTSTDAIDIRNILSYFYVLHGRSRVLRRLPGTRGRQLTMHAPSERVMGVNAAVFSPGITGCVQVLLDGIVEAQDEVQLLWGELLIAGRRGGVRGEVGNGGAPLSPPL